MLIHLRRQDLLSQWLQMVLIVSLHLGRISIYIWFLCMILLCMISIYSGHLGEVSLKLLSICFLCRGLTFSWNPNLYVATSCLFVVGYPTGYWNLTNSSSWPPNLLLLLNLLAQWRHCHHPFTILETQVLCLTLLCYSLPATIFGLSPPYPN